MDSTHSTHHRRRSLQRDAALIIISIFVAVLIVKTGVLAGLLKATADVQILSSFIAGMFFTSVFTTPIAIAFLGEIALVHSPWVVAFVGAFGALLGDLIIMTFIKSTLSEGVGMILSMGRRYHRFRHIIHAKIFHWLTPLVGAIVIASPLPDELGLAMMGLSKMKMKVFIPVSLIMNFLGILIIGFIARSLA